MEIGLGLALGVVVAGIWKVWANGEFAKMDAFNAIILFIIFYIFIAIIKNNTRRTRIYVWTLKIHVEKV